MRSRGQVIDLLFWKGKRIWGNTVPGTVLLHINNVIRKFLWKKINDLSLWSPARSNCSSSHRCHRSSHRGSTWFLLSRCKDTNKRANFQINYDLFYHFSQNLHVFQRLWLFSADVFADAIRHDFKMLHHTVERYSRSHRSRGSIKGTDQ